MKRDLLKFTTAISAIMTVVVLTTGCTTTSQTTTSTPSPSPASTATTAPTSQSTAVEYKRAETITSADEAKKLLVEGNKRFTANSAAIKNISLEKRKKLATDGQKPFAVIVSCSDSRVPPEEIFDQALGDLFVIRDAGNVVDPVTLGSVEYGVEHLGAPLIVVLGHEKCGAVKATVDGGEASENITAIINKIKPALEKVKATTTNKDELYTKCEDENVKTTIEQIKKSSVIKHLEEEKKVKIVGAKYHIETGEVTFDAE